MTTTIRARTPADLLVLLPYLLGYHPRRSVVVAAVRDRQLGMIQRMDLLDDPDDCALVAARMVEAASRERPEAVVVAAFEDLEGESLPLRAALVSAAGEAGLPVHRDVVSRGGRWFGQDRAGAGGRDRGRLLPSPDEVPAVAELVRQGVSPLPDREAFVSVSLPTVDAARAQRVAAVIEAHEAAGGPAWPTPDAVTRVWRCVLDPAPDAAPVAQLPDASLAVAVASLHDVLWRDALLGALGPGTIPVSALDPGLVERARAATAACPWAVDDAGMDDAGVDDERAAVVVLGRLAELLSLVPVEVTAPLLTTMAHLAWWEGDGTVAGACLERALEIDPGHRLAGLMLRLLQQGIRLRGRLDETGVA